MSYVPEAVEFKRDEELWDSFMEMLLLRQKIHNMEIRLKR